MGGFTATGFFSVSYNMPELYLVSASLIHEFPGTIMPCAIVSVCLFTICNSVRWNKSAYSPCYLSPALTSVPALSDLSKAKWSRDEYFHGHSCPQRIS